MDGKPKRHRIVAVTPAGRRRYLEILASYVLRDSSIDEWHLWDNCRVQADRDYILDLAKIHAKVRVITEPGTDGTIRSVSKFYKHTRDPDTFYIKLDDDIVYLPKDFGLKLYSRALSEKNQFSWWSPLVINNAICTYLLRAKGIIETKAYLTAQANCPTAWESPLFARRLHEALLGSIEALGEAWQEAWQLDGDYSIFLQRYSINAIGFFGDLSASLGGEFCPEGVDDEEYISAQLPLLTGKPGRLVGDILVVHFSFYPQEDYLLKTNLLERYARLAGLAGVPRANQRSTAIRKNLKELLRYNAKYFLNKILGYYTPKQQKQYVVTLNNHSLGRKHGEGLRSDRHT